MEDKLTQKVKNIEVFKALAKLVHVFNSPHPFDKEFVRGLVKGGMTKEEVDRLKELLVKVAKSYYGEEKEEDQKGH